MSDLELRIAAKRFPAAGRVTPNVVLEDLSLDARHGEFVCVTGPSGCGKTTLLNLLAGLDADFEGRIRRPKVAGRREPVIGYVFQTPRLLPWRTVEQNLRLVLPGRGEAAIVDELLSATRLENVRHVHPQRLSLGMQRRVALARAFAVEPDLLLMDEPFVSLDEPTAHRLRMLLLEIWRRKPTTVLFVTHDLREAIQLGERLVVLSATPARVRADITVDLDATARAQADAVERCRIGLVAAHPELAGRLS